MTTIRDNMPLYLIDMEGKLLQRLKLLGRYKPLIRGKLERLKRTERGGLTELAKRTRIDPARFSGLIQGKCNLTTDYIVKFVAAGFITVEELKGGRSLEDMERDEAALIEYLQIVEDQEWIKLIIELKKRGIQKESMGKSLIKTLIEQK